MCYFSEVFDEPEETVEHIARMAEKLGKFDFVAGTGLSGTLLLVPVGLRLKKPIIAVRKKEVGHSTRHERTEGISPDSTYIIVDDFVSTGDTVKRIKEELSAFRCVGVVCYRSKKEYDQGCVEEWAYLARVSAVGRHGLCLWTEPTGRIGKDWDLL